MKIVLGKPGRVLFAAVETGKPRRFKIEAYDGGPLPVDGFDLPVIVDLSSLEYPSSIPILIDHTADVEHTLGSTDSIVNNGMTLFEEGVVTATSQTAVGVVAQADNGQQWQASIGVRVGDLQEIAAGQMVTVNKQSFRGPVYVARNSQMFETSVLPAGADWTTTVNLAARAARLLKGTAIMSFEDWVKSLGIDPAALTEDNKAAMTLAYDAVQNPPAAPPATPVAAAPVPVTPVVDPKQMEAVQAKANESMLASMAINAANEINRQTQIALLCKNQSAIMATAIRERWSPEKTEIAVLREEKKIDGAPRGFVKAGAAPLTDGVLLAAVCQARKIPGIEKQFDAPTLQSAHTAFRGGIGLQQILLHAACANGYDAGPGERISNNLRPILKAAFTSVSLPGVLSNLANKELLAGYEADAQLMLWREIAEIKSVSDFKTATSYRLLDDSRYEELAPGGKIRGGSLGEESYTRQAKTYAKMFSLTRTDIINDDLGAFDDLRKRLGQGAATKLSDVFWATFLANSSFFTSGRGNYISGSTTNLGTDAVGLQLGVNAFRTLRSPTADGSKRVGGEPALLMVPTELATPAEQYYKNLNYGAGTTVANSNVFANKYRPLIVPWLSDSSFSGYSATAWYLFREPSKYAPMVVSFLNGQEQPTVESAEADFDTLAVDFRGFHDFGCDQAEYLAGVKSKGAA